MNKIPNENQLIILEYINDEKTLLNLKLLSKNFNNLIDKYKNKLLKILLLKKYKINVILYNKNFVTYKRKNKAVSFKYNKLKMKNKYLYILKNFKNYFDFCFL